MKLEDLRPSVSVRGIAPDPVDPAAAVTVVGVEWHGADALTLIYRRPSGGVAEEVLYRYDEARLEVVEQGRPWSFDGDGAAYRLVAEALRIRLAHLFDPLLAVHTSLEGKSNIPLFLYGAPNRDKARLTTIMLSHFHRCELEFESLPVFEDRSKIPRLDLARLPDVGAEMVSSPESSVVLRRKLLRRAA